MPTSNFSTAHERVFWFWALIILCIFALFRLPGLGVPLASDELATVSLWAQMPALKIFSNYQYPNNHILLTLVLSFLLKTFGLKEWLLRMPLLVSGIVSILLAYKLGRRISGNIAVGLATAFLMAVSEKHIYFSTNARGYIILMMLALMAVAVAMDRLEGIPPRLSKGLNAVLAFFGWTAIWVMGTWTIPTFLFFVVSVALFFAGIFLAGNHVFKKKHLIVPLLSTVVGGLVFYLQYYMLIDSTMLAAATAAVVTATGAKTSLLEFVPALLAEWTNPFEPAGILFFLFALLGLGRLFRQNRVSGFLMACVWLGPVAIGVLGFLLGKLPTVPYPRTFFYLQPFFLILAVMGTRETGLWVLTLLNKNPGFNEKGVRVMAGVLAGIIFLIAGLNFSQQIYPLRLSREPLNKVHDFVRKLNPNDLLLVSHKMHVEFYLYGAHDMRNRIKNILHEGKLGNIYFLGREKRFLSFYALNGNAGKEGLTLPEEAVEVVERFDPFVFYRLKQDWVKPLPGWEEAGSFKTGAFRWEKGPPGIRSLIRFEDSFTVTRENREQLFHRASGLTLNLMEVSGSEKFFSAVLLGGRMKEGNIVFDPSWLPNIWILDHPYGSDVFNRRWNPAIFISQGAGHLSILDVKFSQRLGHGAVRNFLSYRINKP
jgi:hypothetical protein